MIFFFLQMLNTLRFHDSLSNETGDYVFANRCCDDLFVTIWFNTCGAVFAYCEYWVLIDLETIVVEGKIPLPYQALMQKHQIKYFAN